VFSSGPELVPAQPVNWVRSWLNSNRPDWNESPSVNEALESATTSSFYLKTIYWTERLFQALRPVRSHFQRVVPGFRGIGVGYFDVEIGEVDGFGVIIHAYSGGYPVPLLLSQGRRESPMPLQFLVELAGRASGRPTPTETDQFLFELRQVEWPRFDFCPAVIRSAQEHLAAAVEHPLGGTSACWVKSRVGWPLSVEGFLTAKHVVEAAVGHEPQMGETVPMATGGTTTVGDLAPGQIDAAVLKRTFPNNLMQLGTQPYVAQYMPVEIQTLGNPITSTVTAVTDTYNVWDDPDIPAYLELDRPASPGDSGSLVIDTTTKSAAGIYRGEFNAPYPKRRSGRAAHIRQLEALMGLELYQ
jgi:hypothetical protein